MAQKQKLDIEKASAEEIREVGGLAASEAETIVKWRADHETFHSFEESKEIPGLGEKAVEKLRMTVEFPRG